MLGVALTMGFPHAARADTVLEKVARTGVLTVGTRIDTVPYAYIDDQGQLVGYSIDIINLIKKQLEAQLEKEITIQVVQSETIGDRILKLKNGEIDIACDTAFTWERDKIVDFTVSYSLSGIRLAVPKGNAPSTLESLQGKRIGVLGSTIAEQTLKTIQPQANLVPFQTIEQGMQALQEGKVDALAGDTVVLAGMIAKAGDDRFTITPPEAYASYGVSCMVPENNSGFLDLVNYSLVAMMQRYLNGDPATIAQVNRWFGSEGIVEIPPEIISNFFQAVILMREQVPPSSN